MIRVLFVCTGNICRSPTAEGVFRALVEKAGLDAEVAADSAGTIAYHVGESPDPRSQETALERGIDLSGQRARQFQNADFELFDYVIALDSSHQARLSDLCPAGEEGRIRLLMEFAPDFGIHDVPDPYYVGDGFDRVYAMIEAAAAGLLDEIRDRRL
ncbi:MAG: low molecular weight protein-tyrosine-phosphatase [Alphaproteobacteria bacterium]